MLAAMWFKGAPSRAAALVATATIVAMACEDGSAPPTEPTVAVAPTPDPALPGLAAPDAALTAKLEAALAAKGAAYGPRAEHKTSEGKPKFINRLIFEASPYLLQHAHNPVNWYAWGDEPFVRARAEGKPVLLSIGYATCHWCHVMERESFEDLEIAAYLNQNYVCIKVDREERPDVDAIYMTAVQLLSGRGGWPMTVVLTPDREPFFAGTYLPARDGDRGTAKGLSTLLRELTERYRQSPAEVVREARSVSERIAASNKAPTPATVPGPELIEKTARSLSGAFDDEWGGFGGAPKFPTPVRLELLLRYARRSGDEDAEKKVRFTLDRMAAGGIYDHVGGGFHRYSTDRRWLVPHFEKMLYDNAQLAALYLEGYQVSRDERYRRVATEILDYVAREMTDTRGAFYAATDAESLSATGKHEEGAFFTWTLPELRTALGEERAPLAAAFFGVTQAGHLAGRSVLSANRTAAEVAADLGVAPDHLASEIEASKKLLYAARQKRKAPLRDDKIITSYNGLMISAFARGAWGLERSDYAERAEKAATFVLEELRDGEGRLLRSFAGGQARHKGYLDDYAFLIQGLLDLHEATNRLRWLEEAIALQAKLDAHYADPTGGYFMTASDAEKLLTRSKPSYDGSEPSGNSIALSNLLRLGTLTGRPAHRKAADQLLGAFAIDLRQGGATMTRMLGGLDFFHDQPREVVLVSPAGGSPPGLGDPLLAAARAAYLPNRALVIAQEGPDLEALARLVPWVADKRALRDKTTAFVCTEGRCELPTSDPAVLARQLAKAEPLGGGSP